MALSLNNRYILIVGAGSAITSSLFLSYFNHKKANLISKSLESKLKSIIEGLNTKNLIPLPQKVIKHSSFTLPMSKALSGTPLLASSTTGKEKVPITLPSLNLSVDTAAGTSALPLHFPMRFGQTISNEDMIAAVKIFQLPRELYSEESFSYCCAFLNQLATRHGYSGTPWTYCFKPGKLAKSYLSIPDNQTTRDMLVYLGIPVGASESNRKLTLKHPLELKRIFNLAKLASISTTVKDSTSFKYFLLPKIDIEALKNALKEKLGAENFNDRRNGLAFDVKGSGQSFVKDVLDLINKLVVARGERSLTDIDAKVAEKVISNSLTVSRSSGILSVQLSSHFALLFLADCLL